MCEAGLGVGFIETFLYVVGSGCHHNHHVELQIWLVSVVSFSDTRTMWILLQLIG